MYKCCSSGGISIQAVGSQAIPIRPGNTYRCYGSEMKGILAIRSQAIPASGTTLKRKVFWLSKARLFLYLRMERHPGHWKSGDTYSCILVEGGFTTGMKQFCFSPRAVIAQLSTQDSASGGSLKKCSSSLVKVVTALSHSTLEKDRQPNLIQEIYLRGKNLGEWLP